MKNVYLLVKSAFVLVGMSLSVAVFGQAATLSGTITDPRGETLPGVTVMVEGTGQGTISDIDGVYQLAFDAPGTYVINFTYIGYKKLSESITLASGQNMSKNVSLEEDALMLETAVVVGYGTVKKKVVTGSITIVVF